MADNTLSFPEEASASDGLASQLSGALLVGAAAAVQYLSDGDVMDALLTIDALGDILNEMMNYLGYEMIGNEPKKSFFLSPFVSAKVRAERGAIIQKYVLCPPLPLASDAVMEALILTRERVRGVPYARMRGMTEDMSCDLLKRLAVRASLPTLDLTGPQDKELGLVWEPIDGSDDNAPSS